MADPLIIAAPLLIAAVVMAVRFVGCSFHPGEAGMVANTSYSQTVLGTQGLVSFWLLDEPSGTTAVDSKDGNNGTYHGAVTLGVPGLVSPDSDDTNNSAAEFDGQTGYVSVPFAASLNPPAFTVEALVQPAGIDPNKHVVVSSDTGYQLVLNGSAFEASVAAGGAFQSPVVVNAGAEAGLPYYVAMTYDGTNLQLYVNPAASDGEQYFQSNESPGYTLYKSVPIGYQPATSNELRIGTSTDGGPPAEFFQGAVQDVAVNDRAHGENEIVEH